MIAKIAGLLVFSFWIGDEDRGISDLIFHDDELVSLDYGLCFPRDVSAGFLKGYHPHVRDYRNVNRLKKCYYQKRSLTAFLFRDCLLDPYSFVNHETLYAIERIDSHWLEQTVESAGLSSAIAFTLAERARTLRNDYVDWIGALARYFEGVGSANGDDSRFE